MQIQWIQYGDQKVSKYLLILNLGIRNRKVCALECNKVPNREVDLIKSSEPILATISLADTIKWLKTNCPDSYRLAYREFLISKMRVVNQY
jgi:hypothetical protein